jgi:hypothetical protein
MGIRTLYARLRDEPTTDAAAWVSEFPAAFDPVRPAGYESAHQGPAPTALLAELDALSRVLDLLIGSDAYPRFAAAVGLSTIGEDRFHPFFHEIVAVEQADDPDEPITLLAEVWPGYLLGSLLVERAGVRVRAGAAHVLGPVATGSRLHWASWRSHRPTADFGFRRDHRTPEALYYNVDARPERLRAGSGEPDLSSCERLELLRHRCVLRRADAAATAWPWAVHLRYCESRVRQSALR